MKTTKRIVCIVAVMVMLLAMTVNVSAEFGPEFGSILIRNNDTVKASERIFDAYKVLDLKAYTNDAGEITTYEYIVPADLADFYATRYNLDKTATDFSVKVRAGIDAEADLYAFARDVVEACTSAAYTGKPVENGYQFTGLPLGYYTIVDSTAQGDFVKPVSAIMLDTVTPNREIVVMEEPTASNGNRTEKDEAETTAIEVAAVDSEGNGLEGAEFALIGEGKDITATSDQDGIVCFEDLSAGAYTIKEIKAPRGYNILTETLDVIISRNEETGKFTYEGAVDRDGNARLAVVHLTGTELPTIGTEPSEESDPTQSSASDNEDKNTFLEEYAVPLLVGAAVLLVIAMVVIIIILVRRK